MQPEADLEVLDGEVVGEATSHVKFGWCLDGNHVQCPAFIPEHRWPDPARRGAFYTSPARGCSCACHDRSYIVAPD